VKMLKTQVWLLGINTWGHRSEKTNKHDGKHATEVIIDWHAGLKPSAIFIIGAHYGLKATADSNLL
ncbi:MAG: hypothetical protein MJK04_10140, partial [Psychrosphaera sp.]|nr:hypothetical protein [Psychrosphaera sp.]